MPEHDVHGDRAVYDHEIDEPRSARRRRAVADWGVGEEIFDRMPSSRRRFGRGDAAPRRDSHSRDRHEPAPRGREEREPRGRGEVAPRERAEREPRGRGEVAPAEVAPPREVVAAAPVEPREVAAPGERRTVVIRGHGAEAASVSRRERPPRTAVERLGPRPDRIAAWAVALGVLLILIAFLSS